MPAERITHDDPSQPPGARAQLDRYLRQLRCHPLLSREEERALTVDYVRNRDPAVGRHLIEANLRLVVRIAFSYRRFAEDVQDLIQEGNLGLLQAVDRYDPNRGVKLATFAAWWIRAYILRFMVSNRCLVRLGTTEAQRKLFFRLGREQRRLEARGLTATTELLAQNLSVSEKDIVMMRVRMGRDELSLHSPSARDSQGKPSLGESLAADPSQRPDQRAEEGEFSRVYRSKLRSFGRTLRGRELTLFDERLLAENPKTLREVGQRYSISRERTRQIEQQLLARLRTYLQTEIDVEALEAAAA